MRTDAGATGDVLSGTLPAVKDEVLVIGTPQKKDATWVLVVEEIRRGETVIVGKAAK